MAEAAYRLNGPQASPAVASGIQIQIGAYSTEAEAERQLASARERAGSLLAGGQSVAIATQSNGRTVFRARFAGFDAARAASVCTELRRKQIDCLVAKAE